MMLGSFGYYKIVSTTYINIYGGNKSTEHIWRIRDR